MIHIRKGKSGQFRVVYAGKNGEVLAVSESLKSKQSAWKNVRAMGNAMSAGLSVQDDTTLAPVVYWVGLSGKRLIKDAPVECKYKF